MLYRSYSFGECALTLIAVLAGSIANIDDWGVVSEVSGSDVDCGENVRKSGTKRDVRLIKYGDESTLEYVLAYYIVSIVVVLMPMLCRFLAENHSRRHGYYQMWQCLLAWHAKKGCMMFGHPVIQFEARIMTIRELKLYWAGLRYQKYSGRCIFVAESRLSSASGLLKWVSNALLARINHSEM